MRKRLLIPIVGAAMLAILGGAGAYVYFFSGLRTSPAALALSSPTPSASGAASQSTSTAAASFAGSWEVGSNSQAGYRVKEQFIGQTSTHEAVARTTSVTGQLSIAQSGTTYQLRAGTITVQLSSLASVDQVAGYNVTNRDRIVSRTLDVNRYPTAVFQAQAVAISAGAENGQTVTFSVPGQLIILGVTKTVTATVQLKVSGSTTAQAVGSISIHMSDYGITPPSVPFTTVQTAVTIEFQVNLTKMA